MSCCGGDSAHKQIQNEINRQLKIKRGKSPKREFKLLLLGTGESGKSTVLKQMQIIYGQGFTDEKKKQLTGLIYRNLLRAVKALYTGAVQLNLSAADAAVMNHMQKFAETPEDGFVCDDNTAKIMTQIWTDEGVKKIYNQRSNYDLPDSASYFFSHAKRIGASSYTPSQQDILQAREATTGIHDYVFDTQERNVMFRMIDVGGQRSERRKWIHCFENVTSIIFIVASSEFDQVLAEDRTRNRMQESLDLFQHIVLYQWFKRATFILFLNKSDLLEEKVGVLKSDISVKFPAFKNLNKNPFDVKEVQKFIKSMYMERATKDADGNVKKESNVFTHFTCATDTGAMKKIFAGVKTTIMREALDKFV